MKFRNNKNKIDFTLHLNNPLIVSLKELLSTAEL